MRLLILALATLCAAACTTMPPITAHQPTLANVQLIRQTQAPAISLGEFALAPGVPAGLDRAIAVRAEILRPPNDTTFSQYLRQTLEAELTAAGKLDAASGTTLSGFLTQSNINTGGNTSSGTVGARFVLTRAGQVVYDDEHVVTHVWPSEFLGAIAIPEAMDRYTGLYPALVTDLFGDAEFQRAVRGQ